MKHFKTFNEANATNSWSIKKSFTGSIFTKIFSTFSFGMKTIKIKNIAKEYDEYLNVVYLAYLKDRNKKSDSNSNISDETISDSDIPKEQTNVSDDLKMPNNDNDDNTIDKEKDLKEFTDLGFDIDEIEGLLKTSKTPQEVDSHLKSLRDIAEKTQKSIGEILLKINDGTASDLDNENYDKLKERLDRVNLILKKVKSKPSESSKYFESMDWTGNAIKAPVDWSEDDRKNVTAKVNPYKIEEFSLRKRSYVESEEDSKKGKKLDMEWSLAINNIHKKWFYIYEITKLDDKYKSTIKKENPTAIKSAKTLEVLKTSFNDKSVQIHSINDISYNSSYYVLSNFNNDLILLYKIEGIKKIFKVVGTVDISENKSKIDWFDSNKSSFVWTVNTKKYKDFIKDTYLQTDGERKLKLKMSTTLGKDYPCIEAINENGYFNLVSFYKEGNEIKRNTISIRDIPFTLYNVKGTEHIDVKTPSNEISDDLKKII